jgi:hypothetical protein
VRGGRAIIAPVAIFAGLIMITLRVLIFSAMAATTSSTTYAGPCADQIDAMQARIDAKLEAKAAAGPTAKEGVLATMNMQPLRHRLQPPRKSSATYRQKRSRQ